MRQFLQETGELYYWAMFCPAKLQARMNDWAPQEEQDGHRPDTAYNNILLFGANARFLTQFMLLALLLCLPLAVAVATGGQPLDWLFVAVALFSAYGIAVWFLPLGLHLPLLFALVYAQQPAVLRVARQEFLALLSPWPQLAAGLGAGSLGLGLTTLAGYRLWQRGQVVPGRWVFIIGATLSVAGGGGVAGRNWWLPLLLGGFTALFVFAGIRDENDPDRAGVVAGVVAVVVAGVVAGGVVVAFVFVGVFAGGVAGVFAGVVMVAGGVVVMVAGGVAGVVAGGVAVVVAGIALLPLSWLLPTGWLVGVACAPARRRWWWVLVPVVMMVMLTVERQGWWALTVAAMTLAGYYRLLPNYPALALMSLGRALRLPRLPPPPPLQALHRLPPHLDEILWLPLPGHSRILVDAFREDAAAAMPTFDQMRNSRYPGFRRTVRQALPLIVLEQFARVESVTDIVATSVPAHPILPRLLPALYRSTDEQADDETPAPPTHAGEMNAATLDLLYQLRDTARSIEANLGAGSVYLRRRGLENSQLRLARLEGQLPALGLPERNRTLVQQILTRWQTVIEQEIARQQDIAQAQVINPFQSGNPLRADRDDLFKGRRQFADALVAQVLERSRPTLVLHGPRRCGKSSFLLHLPRLLPVSEIIPVYVDLQSAATTTSESDFWYGLVRAMGRDLRSQGTAAPPAQRSEFRASPYAALEDWLDQMVPLLRERRVLLCLDEFEKLGSAIQQDKIPLTLFDELRHLIQHHDELGFLFCGVQTLDELGPNWSSYFISVRPIEMTYLEPAEAHDLLTNPDPAFNLGYAAGIVEQVLLETRCQPYLLQLLGEAMVTQANRHQTQVVTDALLEQAFAAALKTGEPYFTNLWTEYTGSRPAEVRAGQALLHAIAHGHPLPNDATAEDRAALRRLLRYHVVETVGSGYRCEVPLVARWVRERAVLGE